ncbi:SH3 domain-containing protein [Clostridium botulinum]|uniref:SH3 domain-containing protein n=1 Tax=Clostridium botulinum TaxID=1491 RepID=UPI0006A6F917|nr:SH3 domain-containing protein [Clostridium botulinum]APQ96028.1 bacterial SH3 domain protein [Clostridium botulinum]KON10085.1 hypothetical protein ACP52_08060 [Clostridium botulinum]MBN3361670.1 SH3 domain-containing protein [Clostridium botulinum]MBY6907039.1 SH3 domain-containing protein [Clostridium botulinum]MBY6928553.1 SH3 domain-containing protein [Clostridium botulinum]
MKKRLGTFLIALTCVFGMMAAPVKAETSYCGKGVYISKEFLEWDGQYYVVTLDSGYLNIRETPSMNGKIIGKLYNGDKVSLNTRGCFENGFWPVIIR